MTRRVRRRLLLGALGLAAVAWLASGPIVDYLGVSLRWADADRTFLFRPYVQIGDFPGLADPERVEVLWQAEDRDAAWSVESRATEAGPWVASPGPTFRAVRLPKVEPHRAYRATVSGLVPGGPFAYRVARDARVVFEATAKSRPPAGRPHKVAIVGDIAAGTSAASRVAWRIGEEKPDLLVVTGDIVYFRGRTSEYADKFFPVYNADFASPRSGAPLLRSTLAAAAPGNHDLAVRDFGISPDLLEYFFAWSVPRNGPLAEPNAPNSPALSGPPDRVSAYLSAVGTSFPRLANFSLDCGDVHWTFLDANTYADWTDPTLRAWVAADLASARPGAWRLVAFHQPGFNSSSAHANEQQMRLLADVFEAAGVAIAFGGHVHEYQRTRPLTFVPRPGPDGRLQSPDGRVDGDWTLDLAYDGLTRTVPRGVLYVITGAGGASLHDASRETKPETWFPFTAKLVSSVHSYTIMDVSPTRLRLRQVDDAGRTVDSFDVTR